MNILLILTFLFSIGSMLGWCLEVFYRHFVLVKTNAENKWINPGFLTGPCLPIYGFGLCILYLLASLEQYSLIDNYILNKIVLFLTMAVFMTLIEYIAGIIFIKGMNVKLWDYSDRKGNIQGIICPLFSFFWAILGAAYYFLIHPYILNALLWLSNNLTFSFFIGMFFGIFIIDVIFSANLLVKIKAFADDNQIVVRYEGLKETVRRTRERQKKKANFIFALYSETPIAEQLKAYLEKERELATKIKEEIEKRKPFKTKNH